VPNRRRVLIVSANDALREKLIDEAVGLRFSVKAIRLAEELPDTLQADKFDWVILDLEADDEARLNTFRILSQQAAPAAVILVGRDETMLASARSTSAANGLKVVGAGREAGQPHPLRSRHRSSVGSGRSRPIRSSSTISPSSASTTAGSGASKRSCVGNTHDMEC
jgi:hypothetical protein